MKKSIASLTGAFVRLVISNSVGIHSIKEKAGAAEHQSVSTRRLAAPATDGSEIGAT